jgi:hypothetical protein
MDAPVGGKKRLTQPLSNLLETDLL